MLKFRILQIKDIANTGYAFRGYDADRFNLKDYVEVYTGEVDEQLFPIAKYPELHDLAVLGKDVAEACFRKFNYDRPEDFKGHSLSMSDLVEVSNETKTRLYYCDMSGWVRIS